MTGIHRSNPTATVIDTRPGEVRVRLNDNTDLPRWYPSVLVTTPIATVGTMLRKNQEDMVFVPEGVDLSVVGHDHDADYPDIAHTHDATTLTFPDSGAMFLDEPTYAGLKDGLGEVKVFDTGTIAFLTNAPGNVGTIVLSPSSIYSYSNITMGQASPTSGTHLTRKDYVDALVAQYRAKKAWGGGYNPQVLSAAGSITQGSAASVSGLTPGASVHISWQGAIRVQSTSSGQARFSATITASAGGEITSMDWVPIASNLAAWVPFGGLLTNRTVPVSGTISAVPTITWSAGTVSPSNSYIVLEVQEIP